MTIIAFATIRFGEFPGAMMPGLLTRSPGQEPGVCTENLIRVDDVMESHKLAE
jgi:hypothetical protein